MDLRFARLMALMANIVRDPKKPAYPAADFMLDFLTDHDEPTSQTAEQQYALLEQVTQMTGGKVFSADTSDEAIEAWLMGGEAPGSVGAEAYDNDEDEYSGEYEQEK